MNEIELLLILLRINCHVIESRKDLTMRVNLGTLTELP